LESASGGAGIRKVEAQVTVAGHHWERSVAIECSTSARSRPGATRSGRCDLARLSPAPALDAQIPDGEDCTTERHDKKDGTFEQVKKCHRAPARCDRRRLVLVLGAALEGGRHREAVGAGNRARVARDDARADTPPRSAPAAPASATRACRSTSASRTCDVDAAVWSKYKDGQKVTVDVRASSGDVVCGSL